MPSEASPAHTPFGSEFVSWRETKSRAYCKEEDPFLIKRLAWNDVATQHSTQWWTRTPHGFGVTFDVREGSQWIVVATPPQDSDLGLLEEDYLYYFADPRLFIPSPPRVELGRSDWPIDAEAMLLTQGMRMYVYNYSICHAAAEQQSQCYSAQHALCSVHHQRLHYDWRILSFHSQHLLHILRLHPLIHFGDFGRW